MKNMKQLFSICIFFVLLISCQPVQRETIQKPIIYTSIYPLEFIIERLTDNFAITETVFPPGVDAHTYEPTLKDILAIADGTAFVYLGKGMEGSTDKISMALKDTQVNFIEVGKYTEIFQESNNGHDHDHGDYDPHIWFDPARMVTLSEIIKNELQNMFPGHRATITANFNLLVEQLLELDDEFHMRLQNKKNPHIIVSHAAYSYWEHKYNIKQIPISGISSTDEPSQKALAHLIELANMYDLQYVLFEKTSSNRLAAIVQEEIGAQPLYLHNLETLRPEDIVQNNDYFSIMRDNLNTLDKATN